MTRWEYKFFKTPIEEILTKAFAAAVANPNMIEPEAAGTQLVEDWLNSLGNDGWEIVMNVKEQGRMLAKRRVD